MRHAPAASNTQWKVYFLTFKTYEIYYFEPEINDHVQRVMDPKNPLWNYESCIAPNFLVNEFIFDKKAIKYK